MSQVSTGRHCRSVTLVQVRVSQVIKDTMAILPSSWFSRWRVRKRVSETPTVRMMREFRLGDTVNLAATRSAQALSSEISWMTVHRKKDFRARSVRIPAIRPRTGTRISFACRVRSARVVRNTSLKVVAWRDAWEMRRLRSKIFRS